MGGGGAKARGWARPLTRRLIAGHAQRWRGRTQAAGLGHAGSLRGRTDSGTAGAAARPRAWLVRLRGAQVASSRASGEGGGRACVRAGPRSAEEWGIARRSGAPPSLGVTGWGRGPGGAEDWELGSGFRSLGLDQGGAPGHPHMRPDAGWRGHLAAVPRWGLFGGSCSPFRRRSRDVGAKEGCPERGQPH